MHLPSAFTKRSRTKRISKTGRRDHYEIDARKGGMFKMGLESDGYAVTGEFLEIVPNEKIVYSWKMNEYDEKGKLIPNWSQETPTKVTVKFEKAGNRGTKVTLVHEGFPEMDEQYYMHEAGWDLLAGQVFEGLPGKNSRRVRKMVGK